MARWLDPTARGPPRPHSATGNLHPISAACQRDSAGDGAAVFHCVEISKSDKACRRSALDHTVRWLPVILAVTGLALAGCNANQGVNPSGQANLGNIYPNYSPYNPIQYAQTSGFYGGR
jgi:hypothetical protein